MIQMKGKRRGRADGDIDSTEHKAYDIRRRCSVYYGYGYPALHFPQLVRLRLEVGGPETDPRNWAERWGYRRPCANPHHTMARYM